ncbi:MAG: hypothetical protein RR894_09130 [Terrisporobacter sp.]
MGSDNKGRPCKITNEELSKILLDYASRNQGKITYLQLEKETGIKRHVWARRMKSEIDSINNKAINIDTSNFEKIPLPNVVDIIEKYFGNKQKLIDEFLSYNDYIQSLWDKAIKLDNTELLKTELTYQIKELEKENKYLKDNADYYKKEYEKIVVESTYISKQDEKGIKDAIKTDNNEKIISADWRKNFPNLIK